MIRLALILPLLLACSGHRQLCAYPTDHGWDVYATRDVFEARFPDTRATLDIGGSLVVGRYDGGTRQCWVSCDNPEKPTATDYGRMDHEICHAVTDQMGWSIGRFFWARLAKEHPAMMTHPAINARLKAEHLWPSIFRGDF